MSYLNQKTKAGIQICIAINKKDDDRRAIFKNACKGKKKLLVKSESKLQWILVPCPIKINKWHLLPFIINHLNGYKWIFITIYYLGQLVDANRFCADLSTSLQQSGWQIPERNFADSKLLFATTTTTTTILTAKMTKLNTLK